MNNVLLGCDPELFVTRNGSIIPVVGLLGGTKRNPMPVPYGTLQEDNVLAEIGITPAASLGEWLHNINAVQTDLERRMNAIGCSTLVKSSHRFTMPELRAAGRQAMVMGCDRDINAYTGTFNKSPRASTLRTTGGHIHIGMDGVEDKADLVRRLDLFLGIPSLLMDDDADRRKVYGTAGAYRDKPYGLEYRTLSSFWLASDELKTWAYTQTMRAIECTDDVNSCVEAAINSHDVEYARHLVSKHKLEVVA